mgnify:CR=1 FL=1
MWSMPPPAQHTAQPAAAIAAAAVASGTAPASGVELHRLPRPLRSQDMR